MKGILEVAGAAYDRTEAWAAKEREMIRQGARLSREADIDAATDTILYTIEASWCPEGAVEFARWEWRSNGKAKFELRSRGLTPISLRPTPVEVA